MTINHINPEFRIPRSDIKIRYPEATNQENKSVRNPEEAAKEFEKVLVRQFVQVLTEQMFESNLAGEEGPGWMKSYGNQQRETLTDILSDHLVEKGTFDISSTMLKQWEDKGYIQP